MFHKPGTVVAVLNHEGILGFKAEITEYHKIVTKNGTQEEYHVEVLTAGFMGEPMVVPAADVIAWPKHGLFKGSRVGLHPATDTWMRGDKYGTVMRVTPNYFFILLDVSNKIRRFTLNNLINPDTKEPYV